MFKRLAYGLLLATIATASSAAEVNVYSARNEALIKPFLDRFTTATGIEVNLVTGDADALLKRLESEGQNTPADVLITVDAGRLYRAKQLSLLQAVDSALLKQAVPASLRDQDDMWYGLSRRARVIVYNKARVKPSELSSYEALTEPQWKGRVCVRSSDNIYNQSLLAGMIASQGEAAAEQWARGLVANFARDPKGNDRAQVKAVAVGECDVALINSYYLGQMLTSTAADGEKDAAEQVGLFYPNQQDRGTHVNISGAGVTRHAPHKTEAVALLEFLISDAEQRNYAEDNHEYPVKAGIAVSPLVGSWGIYPFKADPVSMNQLGEYNAAALKIFDRVGWR